MPFSIYRKLKLQIASYLNRTNRLCQLNKLSWTLWQNVAAMRSFGKAMGVQYALFSIVCSNNQSGEDLTSSLVFAGELTVSEL